MAAAETVSAQLQMFLQKRNRKQVLDWQVKTTRNVKTKLRSLDAPPG